MADMVAAGDHVPMTVDPASISFNEEEEPADVAGADRKELPGAGRREVGDQDQVWSLSTAKPGNGVEQLRDGDLETYWQCDTPPAAPRAPLARPPLSPALRRRCVLLQLSMPAAA